MFIINHIPLVSCSSLVLVLKVDLIYGDANKIYHTRKFMIY